MIFEISKADWACFRQLHSVALERYCHRVLQQLTEIADDQSFGYHQRYLNAYDFIKSADKNLASIFDAPRRSSAVIQILKMHHEGLITEEEFMGFSAEIRDLEHSLLGDDSA